MAAVASSTVDMITLFQRFLLPDTGRGGDSAGLQRTARFLSSKRGHRTDHAFLVRDVTCNCAFE